MARALAEVRDAVAVGDRGLDYGNVPYTVDPQVFFKIEEVPWDRLEGKDPSLGTYEDRSQQRVEPNVRSHIEYNAAFCHPVFKRPTFVVLVASEPATVVARASDPLQAPELSLEDGKHCMLRHQAQGPTQDLARK
jgi:hypothetical protein